MDNFFTQVKSSLPEPDKTWMNNSRDFLVAKFETSRQLAGRAHRDNWLVSLWERFAVVQQLALRPVALGALVVAIVLGGPLSVVKASESALPGSSFYKVKVVVKQAKRLATAVTQQGAELEVAFVGQSITDVGETRLVQKDEMVKRENITKALEEVKKDIEVIDKKLTQGQSGRKAEVVTLARLITKQKHNYKDSLNKTKDELPLDVQKEVSATIGKLEEVGDKSLKILAQEHEENGEGLPKEELALLIEEKIASVKDEAGVFDNEQDVDNLKDLINEQKENVEEKLAGAEELVKQNKFYMALVQVDQANQKVKAVKEMIEKVTAVATTDENLANEIEGGVVEGVSTTTEVLADTQVKKTNEEIQDKGVSSVNNQTSIINHQTLINDNPTTTSEVEALEFKVKIGD